MDYGWLIHCWRGRGGVVLGCVFLGVWPAGAQTYFSEVTDPVLPAGVFSSRPIAFGDYDNDGWPDLFLMENRSLNRVALLHNQGGTHFELATAALPLSRTPTFGGGGAVFGDYDNDGDLDLFAPMGSCCGEPGRNLLLRNDQGVFREVGLEAGLTDVQSTDNAIWLDYDRDGYLDLYQGNQHASNAQARNRLYRNQGDGTFADVTEVAGLSLSLHPTLGGSNGGMAAGDFNDDGWPDLYVGVYDDRNRLFLNDGQGGFVDATTGDIGDPGQALGVAVGDIDNDGDLDLFQAAGGGGGAYRSVLLLNLGNGQFIDALEGVGLAALAVQQTAGVGLADLDNDGDLDLLVASPHFLFMNNGDGTFAEQTSRSGILKDSWDVAFGDWDRDGFLDLLFGMSQRPWELAGLYCSRGNGNHWLKVELVGTKSNRSGIGSRVISTSGDLRQMRELLGGRGYEQDELVAHFGLGQRTQVDRLEIRWPSGQVEVLTNIPADQRIRVIEGRKAYQAVRPVVWEYQAPDSVVAGTPLPVVAEVRPVLFEPGATISRVTADLSDWGGPAAMSLEPVSGDGYRLSYVGVAGEENGWRRVAVLVEQTTSLGAYWTQLSRRIAVLPAEDRVIFADAPAEGWELRGDDKVALDPVVGAMAYEGEGYLAVEGTAGVGQRWGMSWQTVAGIQPVGYALQLALHLETASRPQVGKPVLALLAEEDVPVYLLGGMDSTAIQVELGKPGWQVVEVSLERFGRTEPIQQFRLEGNLRGRWYLDDLRLVAVAPPPSTAVVEERVSGRPPGFALAQNYPNPFNGETVIRYALPERDEGELAVYNLAGQRVVVLVQGVREAGSYAVRWDGRDDQGRRLASGVYLYRLQTAGRVQVRRLAVVR